jgi:hypothetical protein
MARSAATLKSYAGDELIKLFELHIAQSDLDDLKIASGSRSLRVAWVDIRPKPLLCCPTWQATLAAQ